MDRPRRAFLPETERVEERSLLSATPLQLTGRLHAVVTIAISTDATGTSINAQDPKASLTGTGRLASLGAVRVVGKPLVTVQIDTEHQAYQYVFFPINGTLTLANARGSVTLALDHPQLVQHGRGAVDHFVVTGGTGAYQDATGSGSVREAYRVRPPAYQHRQDNNFSFSVSFTLTK